MQIDRMKIQQLAREAGMLAVHYNRTAHDMEMSAYTPELERFAQAIAQRAAEAERERICAAIKEEDDHCATGDYMLDSDDCIKVARGEWQRPDYGIPKEQA